MESQPKTKRSLFLHKPGYFDVDLIKASCDEQRIMSAFLKFNEHFFFSDDILPVASIKSLKR